MRATHLALQATELRHGTDSAAPALGPLWAGLGWGTLLVVPSLAFALWWGRSARSPAHAAWASCVLVLNPAALLADHLAGLGMGATW